MKETASFTKKTYEAPWVKIVSFKVEKGFAQSFSAGSRINQDSELHLLNMEDQNGNRHYGNFSFGQGIDASQNGWN